MTSRRSATVAAIGAGIVVVFTLVVYLPLVGFLGGATASTAGIVPFPVVSVTVVTFVGAATIVGLLALALTRRRSGVAWALVALAVVVALAVTAFPLVAVVIGSAQRIGEIGPVISALWQQLAGFF
ncbi:MFS transporter permease [Rhodococcus sp. 06-1477-1B]|nr:MFS transporter permease [Rhodococcus sp. 06-1477-1B]